MGDSKETRKQKDLRNERRRKIRLSKNLHIEDGSDKIDKMNLGYVALWRGVLSQILVDAKSESSKAADRFNRREALYWIENNSVDFQMICDLAMLDHEYITEKIRDAKERGFRWRAAPKNKK